MKHKDKSKSEKQKKTMPEKDFDLKEIVERRKIQNKILAKMIDSVNKSKGKEQC